MKRMTRFGVAVAATGMLAAGCSSHEYNAFNPVSCESVAPNTDNFTDMNQSFPQLARAVLRCYNSLPTEDQMQGEQNTIYATIPLADGSNLQFTESSNTAIGSQDYLAQVKDVSMLTFAPGVTPDEGYPNQTIDYNMWGPNVDWGNGGDSNIAVASDNSGIFVETGITASDVSRDPKTVACVLGTDGLEFREAMELSPQSGMPDFPAPVVTPNCNAV